ncbi:recombinase family protein [Lactobacillus bombicola]|uniref:Recombinase family protein n=1 Tax=Lactobacillus bombicola TaxID=1505723 RepID=A0A396SWQ6_9LACO|nr:recombinase family protein [Lactobacillus bombicola]RHW55070.1 recombinase family protein [Lactobacillus bombicola]
MAKIGYARVSTRDQNLDRQIESLEKMKVDKLFCDKLSGTNIKRPQLQNMLDYIREDDVVIVTELDRLGRNNQDLTKIMGTIKAKGATLDILNFPSLRGIEDQNLRQLMNNLILELYKYQAESERKRIKERQRQGIEIAKTEGRYHGRKPKYSENSPQLQHAFKLYQSGMSDTAVSKVTGINRITFKRYREKYGITQSSYSTK